MVDGGGEVLVNEDATAVDTLLFVDDEANILSALRRLFRPLGYNILTAESGAQGLELFSQHKIDLVISDMRMPKMDGAQFLEKVREQSPETVRILLTGYADITSTIAAINKGQIYRYISKPWEDNDVALSVRHALERKHLEREKGRLEALTRQQNEELKALNASLEEKVQARTAELSGAMQNLKTAHEKLKKSFFNSIKIFSSLMELRAGGMTGHSRRVADLARRLAIKMGMTESEAQDIMLAALLHDIGKIGMPDKIISKSFSVLSVMEREEYAQHPIKGQMALMGLEQFAAVGRVVRSHHERYDGQGYPDRLRGLDIPIGARILALASDYDALQVGELTDERLGPTEALAYIVKYSGKHYDPMIVDAFIQLMGKDKNRVNAVEIINNVDGIEKTVERGIHLRSDQLKSGMVLNRDLISAQGLLLLSRDTILDDGLIEQLMAYESMSNHPINIYVHDRS